MRAPDMRDTTMAKVDEMADSGIGTCGIVRTNPGRGLFQLIIDDHDGKALLVESRQLL